MKKFVLRLLIIMLTLSANAQRKVETTYLKVKSVKNANILSTDSKGNLIDGSHNLSFPEIYAGENISINKNDPLKLIINNTLTPVWGVGGSYGSIYSLLNGNGDSLGDYAVAFGQYTVASGLYSHSQGQQTQASGAGSHSEGILTKATGQGSHSEGQQTEATASWAHSEGYNTKATGGGAHAEGSTTIASGASAHAEGTITSALGNHSHSGGIGNSAQSYAETSIGSYSTAYSSPHLSGFIPTNRVFNIGNGTSDTDRSDALTVLKNGTITAPSLDISEINTAGNKALITKEYADANYNNTGVTSIVAGTNVSIDTSDAQNPVINVNGGINSTDLSYTAAPTQGTIVSSNGNDAVIPVADTTNAGLMPNGFFESGTFTPTITDDLGGATYTNLTNRGFYSRVGKTVTVQVYMVGINTTGTPTGKLKIGNFPFNNVADPTPISAKILGTDLTQVAIDKISGVLVGNGNFVQFEYVDSNIQLKPTFTNGGVWINATYIMQ